MVVLDPVFTPAQAKNGKHFARKVERLTGILVNGDWRGGYRSMTWGDNGETSHQIGNQDELSFFTYEFPRLPDGGVMAVGTRKRDGQFFEESFIVGVRPKGKSFSMVSLRDNDLVFGSIGGGSKTLSLTKLESEEPGDRAFVGVYELTNVLA